MLMYARAGTAGRVTKAAATGINLIGYSHMSSGLGTAARRNFQILRKVLPALEFPFPGVDHIIGNPYTINFHHWHPESAICAAMDNNPVDVFADRLNIGFWVLETTGVSRQWIEQSARYDEVWTPSEFCRCVLERNGLRCPVKVWPHMLPPVARPARARENELPGFTFLTCYDSQSRSSRKNPFGTIAAFRRAFPRDEDVRLVVKVRHPQRGEEELLRAATHGDRRVTILTHELSRTDMDLLWGQSHAFVSLHRSEGFGLNVAEAMAAGLYCIITGASGCLDFARRDRVKWVAVSETDVADHYFNASGGCWWDPDENHASALMREAWEGYGSAATTTMLDASVEVVAELSEEAMLAKAENLLARFL